MASDAVVPPGGQFQQPAVSTNPLLALRCQPALIPFLPEDANTAEVVVDALVRYAHIAGAQDLVLPDANHVNDTELSVTVSIDGARLAAGLVSLNGTARMAVSLAHLTPRTEPYELSCAGTLRVQSFSSSSSLTYLPSPPAGIGSVTKRDLRTGGVLVKKAGATVPYQPLLPIGFYTGFGGYLEGNDTAVEVLADQGCAIPVEHPRLELTCIRQV
jgi:hypothetical protein